LDTKPLAQSNVGRGWYIAASAASDATSTSAPPRSGHEFVDAHSTCLLCCTQRQEEEEEEDEE
jgi:hypothetical protein